MPRTTILAAVIAVAVGIGWVIWVRMEPPPPAAPAAPAAAPAAAGGNFTVPSGQPITFLARVEEGDTVRFRFLAPALAEGSLADEAAGDMEALCNDYALSHLPGDTPPLHIVISLSSADVPLGDTRPDVTQVFDSYRAENGKCVWEMF